ncbi:hypothetical protein EV192_106423 [Actinocrispum wychmicini]|uniref:Uncharacterized protein n=1 Tax=Actinocrispum wychmicini TaxID=1213861 RepID=A0A4R2JIY7_9PSEU|nr:hypothetical protein EV192_106423 [Actinocrispum wychmicini]
MFSHSRFNDPYHISRVPRVITFAIAFHPRAGAIASLAVFEIFDIGPRLPNATFQSGQKAAVPRKSSSLRRGPRSRGRHALPSCSRIRAAWRTIMEFARRVVRSCLDRVCDVIDVERHRDLARTTYIHPASDLAEIRDMSQFSDRATIDEHLPDSFVPITYLHRPLPLGPPPVATRYSPAQGRQGLTYPAVGRPVRHRVRGRGRCVDPAVRARRTAIDGPGPAYSAVVGGQPGGEPQRSQADVRARTAHRSGRVAAELRTRAGRAVGQRRHMPNCGFAWWRLVQDMPLPTRWLMFCLPAVLFAITDLAGPVMALIYGMPTALAGFAAHRSGTRAEPLRAEVRFQGASKFLAHLHALRRLAGSGAYPGRHNPADRRDCQASSPATRAASGSAETASAAPPTAASSNRSIVQHGQFCVLGTTGSGWRDVRV